MAKRKYIPTAPIGKCKGCGTEFSQVISRGKARAYCDPSCKPCPPPITKICDAEGCGFLARSNRALYCEMHYMRMRRSGTLTTTVDVTHYIQCQHCGKPTNGKKACSERCYARISRGSEVYRSCVTCGVMFMPWHNRVACSAECDRIRKQDMYDSRRCVSSMNPEGRSIRYKVFKRDNWVCGICKQPVNRLAKWPDLDYPTLDHIRPVSKGGLHTMANLQCAHFSCNARKHAKY